MRWTRRVCERAHVLRRAGVRDKPHQGTLDPHFPPATGATYLVLELNPERKGARCRVVVFHVSVDYQPFSIYCFGNDTAQNGRVDYRLTIKYVNPILRLTERTKDSAAREYYISDSGRQSWPVTFLMVDLPALVASQEARL